MNVSTHTTMSNLESEPGASMGDVSAMTRSQTSVNPAGSSATLSMRAKAARKRRINAQHNSNFRAGYVPVEEEALHRAGIRGRKRYFLYCFVVVLMTTAVLNTMVTAWLLYILGLSLHGMTSIELTSVAGRDFLRVLADARIITMSFTDAPLGARYNSTLVLESRGSALQLESSSQDGGSSIRLEGSNITVTTDQFAVLVNDNDWVLANLPSLAAHGSILNLLVDNVTARLIQQVQGCDGVRIESAKSSIDISGAQGVDILSNKTMDIINTLNVFINATMSVTFDAQHGMYFSNLLNVTSDPMNSNNLLTYKVCVCRSGQMFAGTSCDIDPKQLPSICGNTA